MGVIIGGALSVFIARTLFFTCLTLQRFQSGKRLLLPLFYYFYFFSITKHEQTETRASER